MQRARYHRIVFFFARVLLNLAFWDLLLPRLGLRRWSQHTRSRRLSQAGAQFRKLAIQLGGVLIKVGQFLSARVDVMPAEITRELSGLQDEVPAEDFSAIRQLVESELGEPLEAKFIEFNPAPEAAASLGQVHLARINVERQKVGNLPGEEDPGADSKIISLAVKVQRPGIEKLIATDLAALKTVGEWLRRYPPIRRRADIPALLEEFSRILYQEIDYLSEGRNAETFAANFRDRQGVRVPAVVWSHTTRQVLALEDVRGIKITDYPTIAAAGIDPAQVADRLFQVYLQQIFEDYFFHADPHPGNLFVTPLRTPREGEEQLRSEDWLLTFVDFGMVGRVPQNLRTGLREMVIAVGTRDAARVVKSYQLIGLLLPEADLSLLEEAEALVFERFWGKSMGELQHISPEEVRELASQFRQLLYTLPFQVPEDLILLGRCIGILSGMCTGLDPNFNVWEGLSPFAKKLIAEEASAVRSSWIEELGTLARNLARYPRRVESVLERMESGQLSVHDPLLAEKVRRLERTMRRVATSVIFAALLLGGIQVYLAGEVAFGGILLGLAGLTLIGLFLSGLRSRD